MCVAEIAWKQDRPFLTHMSRWYAMRFALKTCASPIRRVPRSVCSMDSPVSNLTRDVEHPELVSQLLPWHSRAHKQSVRSTLWRPAVESTDAAFQTPAGVSTSRTLNICMMHAQYQTGNSTAVAATNTHRREPIRVVPGHVFLVHYSIY